MLCFNNFRLIISAALPFSPHHLVDDAGVALDDFHDLGRDVFFDVVRHRDAVVAVGVHRDGGVNGLQEGLFVDAGDEEAGLVKRFGAFRAGADADCRERVTDACEEGAFFRERATVAHDSECVHLQAVVVVESERFVSSPFCKNSLFQHQILATFPFFPSFCTTISQPFSLRSLT